MLPPWRASNTRTSAPSGATASRATGRCFIANVDTRALRAGILREKFPGAELGRFCELGLETARPVAEELVVGGRLVRLLGVARAAALGDDLGGGCRNQPHASAVDDAVPGPVRREIHEAPVQGLDVERQGRFVGGGHAGGVVIGDDTGTDSDRSDAVPGGQRSRQLLGDGVGGIVDGVLLHELVAGADHRGARDGSAERPEQGARADLARRHRAEVRQRPLDDDDVLAGDLRNGSLVERNVLHRDAAGTRHGERHEDEEPFRHYFSTAPYVMFLSTARTGTRCLGDCIMNTTNMSVLGSTQKYVPPPPPHSAVRGTRGSLHSTLMPIVRSSLNGSATRACLAGSVT